jgi:hypothetical protein
MEECQSSLCPERFACGGQSDFALGSLEKLRAKVSL